MILTLAILSACSTTPSSPDDTPPALFSKLTQNSAFYLKKDELTGKQENSAWQFVALQALIAEKRFILADSIIEYMQSKPLSATEQASLSLLIADSLTAQNRLDKAQQQLDAIDKKKLSELGFIYSLKLQTQLQIRNEDHLAASDSLLSLAPLLKTDEDRQQYNDLLLTQLSLLPFDVLNQYQVASTLAEQAAEASELDETAPIATTPPESDPFKEGWYALASLYKRYQLRSNQLIREVENWKVRYPTHPVLAFMPTALTNIPESSPYQPQNIAVLLPFSGRFQQQAEAVQYGLLHAFYSQRQASKAADEPALLGAPKLHFYDTQKQTTEQITAQFKINNIDFIIGPLIKEEIDKFLPLVEDIPVLALNNFTEQQAFETVKKPIAWHYAFPLSPENEAKQAAQLIAQQHKKPLVIAPYSAYGQRVAEAFSDEWRRLKNTQTESHFFKNKAQLDGFIDGLLQTEKSKSRIAQMKAITYLPLEAEIRSRRDIDAIYIVSKRDELILLKPFIDVSVSRFATTMPLYASSRSHLLDWNEKQNSELSNLVFSDSPFLLDTDNKDFKQVEQAWGKQSLATLRLFALGFDSYQLIEQLMQLQNAEGYTYKGLVGQLSLDQTNTVQAKLSWAKYQQGKLIEVAAPISAE
ncbi:MAG: outer membrane PBP1 activator LpoA protein [Psychromonas sp.]|jgi:outer membrane PBP1 activator LpoA protein